MAVSPSLVEVSNRKFILDQAGDVYAKSGVGDQMITEGWASTDGLDLTREIVEDTAFAKDFPFYEASRFYWFNHDPSQVIGYVKQMHIASHGLHIDEGQLSETKWNREWLWPHLKNKAISQHSIQFMSIDPYRDTKTGIVHHTRIKLIETSIVSIACNPEAVITGLKSLVPSEDYLSATLPELYKLMQEGRLKSPSDVRTDFAVNGFKDNPLHAQKQEVVAHHEEENTKMPDLIINQRDASTRDKGGERVKSSLPNRKSKHYDNVGSQLFLAKSTSRGSYLFRVAYPTKKSWDYDWNQVAASMGYALGVKNSRELAEGERSVVIPELLKVYDALGKSHPTYEDISLGDLNDDVIDTVPFADVKFNAGESEIIYSEMAKSVFAQMDGILTTYAKSGIPSDVLTYVKSVYPSLSIDFYVGLREQADFDFVAEVLQALSDYLNRDEEDDVDVFFMSLEGKEISEIKAIKLARALQSQLTSLLTEKKIDPSYLKLKDASEVATIASKEFVLPDSFKHLDEEDNFFD